MITLQEARDKVASGVQLSPDDAIDLMQMQVDKRGADYVYTDENGKQAGTLENPMCRNVHRKPEVKWECGEPITNETHEPGCIVGSVFVDLVGIEKTTVAGDAYLTNREAESPFNVRAVVILRQAQMRQDSGDSWGESLLSARIMNRPGN